MHMMSYDQQEAHHSTLDFGKRAVALGVAALPPQQLTMGLPFYGRFSNTGDWVTYEDIVQQQHPLSPELDTVQTGRHLTHTNMISRDSSSIPRDLPGNNKALSLLTLTRLYPI
jgi:GH18 family chitinase